VGLQQWSPVLPENLAAIASALRQLKGLLGRTPTWGDHVTKSAAYTLTDADQLVLVDTTAGSVTVTLPSAVGRRGRTFTIKKLIAANTLTIEGDGTETLDGAANIALTTRYAARTVQSDNANWHVVSAHL
jgi:hypothetical protein